MNQRVKVAHLFTKELLTFEYIDNKQSLRQIADKYNTSKRNVLRYIRKYDIPTRNVSEATKLNTPRGKDNWMYGRKIDSSKCSNWKGGITDLHQLIRCLHNSRDWKQKVFARDGFKCVDCGKSGYLHAHHVKPFKDILNDFLNHYSQFSPIEDKETLVRLAINWLPFWDVTNGRTNCKECHYNFHFPIRGK